MEAMLRTFIAVPLAAGFGRKFSELQRVLSQAGTKITWVRPENMHITVKFIGDFPASRLSHLFEIVEDSLSGLQPTRITFKGVSFFPNPRHPRVVIIALEDETGLLEAVHKRLDTALAEEGIRPDNRRFSPHLSLGRVRNNNGISRLAVLAQEYEGQAFGSMDVSSLTVYASKLGRTGPQYSVLAEIDSPA